MSYTDPPRNLTSLNQRLRNVTGSEELALRRRTAMALVVIGQMLPEGAIKGGSAMALRYGRGTRFTTDLDAARVQSLAAFRSDFEDALSEGWAGFTGRLVEVTAPRPRGIPTPYVMQPFDIKLSYRGKSWCTVRFELGHNEIGDADDPEYQLSNDLAELFTTIGLEAPKPVPVMRTDHQIAQKLHAVSTPGSDRAHDLIDLQLLESGEDLNLDQVTATCQRLFAYRQAQPWPPTISLGDNWGSLYAAAAADLDVLPTVEQAVTWANNFIGAINAAQEAKQREM